jgi:hypothetical protein
MAIERADLLGPESLKGLEVWQLTSEGVPSCHVYMEAQVFTPDSRFLVLHRSAHAHGSDRADPQHRYLLCDLAHGCSLTPLTEETGVTGPSVSPDASMGFFNSDESGLLQAYMVRGWR